MKDTKGRGLIIFSILMVAVLLLQRFNDMALQIMACVMGALFLFSILVRRNINFRWYFTSSYNPLTSKINYQKQYDIPAAILFEKMKEVVSEAGFKVRYANRTTGSLLATTSMTFFSWGENIYIDMTERNGTTTVHFCSACLFGITSWGQNEKNYERMLHTFENSLTI